MLQETVLTPEELDEVRHLIPGPEPKVCTPVSEDSPGRILQVSEPALHGKELAYVTECLRSNWISSAGPYIGKFESAFADATGSAFAVCCSSGTAALHLMMAASGLGPGDEVIIPTFTMIATANAVAFTGATPVLVDAEPLSWNIDVSQVEARITSKTKALIAVHTYGHPADMDALQAIADRHGLLLFEDAAEAHGAKYHGRTTGNLSDGAAFSFYANKILTTGEGGMVTTNREDFAKLVRTLRDHAFSENYHFWHGYRGFNYRMTNLQAALGLAQTEQLEKMVALRRQTRALYDARLKAFSGLTLPGELPGVQSVFWMYSILIDEQVFGCSRDEVRRSLARRGIETRTTFVPIHAQPIYFRENRGRRFPVAEDICRQGLYLPSGANLKEAELDYVCRCLGELGSH
ncbi:MAG: DegT/DnrJ/EryC1/StrS family aminotransferase [Terrimicrobiaceae bacterium]